MKLRFGTSQTTRNDSLEDSKLPLMLIATIGVAMICGLAIKPHVPGEGVMPALVISMFAAAGFIGLVCLAAGRSFRLWLLDVAGLFAVVGIIAAASVEPDQMVGLMQGARIKD